jgi:hypothetical protein
MAFLAAKRKRFGSAKCADISIEVKNRPWPALCAKWNENILNVSV